MHLLAVKEALAEERDEAENAEICRAAAGAFLRDHLGRWCPKLDAWLEANACSELYGTAGSLLGRFIELDMEDRERCAV